MCGVLLCSPSLLLCLMHLQLDLSHNALCGLNYRGEGTYTAEGITAIANALKVTASVRDLVYHFSTASLTSVNVLSNKLDVESASMLLKVKAEQPNLRTLCGLTHEETELDLRRKGLGPGDALLLAPPPEISVIAAR